MDQVNEILPGIYLAPLASSVLVDELRDTLQICRVLSIGCTIEAKDHFYIRSFPNVLDQPEVNIFPFFQEWNDFILEAVQSGENILVHCVYGQSRSVSAVLCYIMLSLNESLSSGYALIKSKRPCISINPGFICQLALMNALKRIPFSPHTPKTPSSSYTRDIDISIREIEDADCLLAVQSECSNSLVDSNECLNVCCRICATILCRTSDILLDDVDYESWLEKCSDPFWYGYRPIHSRHVSMGSWSLKSLVATELVVVAGVEWTLQQLDSKAKISSKEVTGSIINNENAFNSKKRRCCYSEKLVSSAAPDHMDATSIAAAACTTTSTTTTTAAATATTTKTNKQGNKLKSSVSALPLLSQIESSCEHIVCPGCRRVIGLAKKQGLRVCNEFIIVDLVAFYEREYITR